MTGFVDFKLKGMPELQAQLLALGAELGAKTLAKAARQAFKPVLEAAKRMVPRDSGELQDSLKLSVKKPKGGEMVVAVGIRIGRGSKRREMLRKAFGKSLPPARRWHWIELGTARQAAHPFLRPALDQNAGAVLELLKVQLVKSIAQAVKKRGGK